MSQSPFGEVLAFLRRTSAAYRARDLSDGELLELFLKEREQAAFSVLVQRHGPMVLGVGQRLLGDDHAAEDVFQATFLVLIRRAASLRLDEPLGGWLHAVAQRLARKARARTAARRDVERRFAERQRPEPLDDLTWQELRPALDEAIAGLPRKYRAAIVLCYLQGKSYDQAARELGWPKSSVASRLGRALELLRQQLVRRGITLSAAALTTALSEKVSAAPVAAFLAINTVKAAISLVGGKAVVGGCLSAGAVALAEETMVGLIGMKAKTVALAMMVAFAVGGAGVVGFWGFSEKQQPAKPTKAQPPTPNAKAPAPQKKLPPIPTDLYGDPLPEGALARLGTVRFRPGWGTFAVAVSPNGKVVATGSLVDFSVSLWDATTGRLLRRLAAAMGASLAFSPDGKLLFTAGERNCIFDVVTGNELVQVGEDRGKACVAFSPDGTMVALSQPGPNAGSCVHLFEVATGKELRQLKWNYTDRLKRGWPSIAFSPSGKILASGSADKMVYLWDVATGKELGRLKGHAGPVWTVAFAPGGKVLASGDDDGAIRLWDVDSGQLLRKWKIDGKSIAFFTFSQDGKLLVSTSHEGVICLWDPETGKEIRRWRVPKGNNQSLALSPDGKVLFSVGYSAVHRWDTATGKELDPPAGHSVPVWSLRYGPGGKTLISSGLLNGEVLEWDLANCQERTLRTMDPIGPGDDSATWAGLASDISPDGKVFAYVRYVQALDKSDPAIRLWDFDAGKVIRMLEGPPETWWRSVRFSPDGKLLASTSLDGVDLWDVAAGKILHHIPAQQAEEATFSPDGLAVVFAAADKTIQVWDTAAGKKIRTLDGEGDRCAFSPDGKLLSAIDRSGLRVWSLASGKEVLRIAGQQWVRRTFVFSPSGRVVAIAASWARRPDLYLGCTIHLWDVQSGQEIRQFNATQILVDGLAMSPDGRTLASGGYDSNILLWDLTGQAETAKVKAAPLTAKDLASLWSDLADAAPKADRAIWTLVFTPQQSLPYLKERLQSVALADEQQVGRLAADLDHENFAVRQKAAKALDDLGEAAEGALRKALTGNIPLEVRQRIEQILEKRDRDALRKLRAVETLEQIGTTEARQVLQEMAKGSPNPRVMEAAGAALKRIANRGL